MNDTNFQLIKNMSKNEYKRFLQFAVGLQQFRAMNNEEIVVRSKKKIERKGEGKNELIDNTNGKVFFAYLYSNSDESLISAFFFMDNDQREFFYDIYNNIYDINAAFNFLTDNEILYLILGVLKKKDYSLLLSQENELDLLYESNERKKDILQKSFTYSFILGSGIDRPFGCMSWDALLVEMKKRVSTVFNVSEKNLNEFENKIGNTNYVIPQVVKDIDEDQYYRIIYDGLYSNYLHDIMDLSINHDFEKETIYQVANVLSVNSYIKKQTALTFNYDNYLEMVLKNVFGVKSDSLFLGETKGESNIEIIHSHGFVPYNHITEKNKESVVLSSFEYMDTYSSHSDFGYMCKPTVCKQRKRKNLAV